MGQTPAERVLDEIERRGYLKELAEQGLNTFTFDEWREINATAAPGYEVLWSTVLHLARVKLLATTNEGMAEMIVAMSEGEDPVNTIHRVALWGDEEWGQLNLGPFARRISQRDRFEVIGMIAVKFAREETK